MEEVLSLLGFQPSQRSGVQWYGVCPLHESTSRRRRSFSVNVAIGRYYCHGCHSHGNQLELWAAATKFPFRIFGLRALSGGDITASLECTRLAQRNQGVEHI